MTPAVPVCSALSLASSLLRRLAAARSVLGSVLLASLLLAAGPLASRADTYYWQGAGTGGNTATDPADPTTLWLDDSNWVEGFTPTFLDDAYLTLTNAGYVNAQTASLYHLCLDGTSAQGALHLVGGVTFAPFCLYAGYGGSTTGNIVQDGGTTTANYGLYLGFASGSTGNYTLGGGTLSIGEELIGVSGTGTFTQTGGTHTVNGSLYPGVRRGSSGILLRWAGAHLPLAHPTIGATSTSVSLEPGRSPRPAARIRSTVNSIWGRTPAAAGCTRWAGAH